MNGLIIIATVALMIFFNALFVAAEFSTVSSRRTKISQMAGEGDRLAMVLLPFIENSEALDRYVAACQIGITISSLVLGAYGQNVISALLVQPIIYLLELMPSITNLFSDGSGNAAAVLANSLATAIVLFVITTLQVVLGELFPKSVAIQYPERLAKSLAWPLRVFLFIFAPLIWFFNGSGALVLRLLGHDPKDTPSQAISPREIELLVTESHEGGLLDDQERQLLRNAFRLRDLTARQVMVHRTKLVATPETSSVTEILELAIKVGYTRIPIYGDTIDEITGFVHVKDLYKLFVNDKQTIQEVLREVVYVPETMPVSDVWEILNTRRKYIAVVFDEFGGTAGLITFEDLIEEIFGELQDEFDDEMALIARDKEGRIYLRGDLLVSDVNEYLELELPTEADTLSGLVFSLLGRPPSEGDEIESGETIIRVESLEDLGVQEVSLKMPPTKAEAPYTEWEVVDYE